MLKKPSIIVTPLLCIKIITKPVSLVKIVKLTLKQTKKIALKQDHLKFKWIIIIMKIKLLKIMIL